MPNRFQMLVPVYKLCRQSWNIVCNDVLKQLSLLIGIQIKKTCKTCSYICILQTHYITNA